jgi:hypothetical protein
MIHLPSKMEQVSQMKKNMGTADKAVRVILALTFIYLYAYEYITGTLGLVLMLVTLFFNISSITGYCPLYGVLGINTCKRK